MTVAAPEIRIDLTEGNEAYDDFMFSESRHFVLVGGAGSGKSYAAADKFIMRGLLDQNHRLIAFRKVAKTLRRSVWPLLRGRLSHWGLYEHCSFNQTEMTLTLPNGSEIWCIGLDDPEKLKSIHGMTSAWIEEATECTPDDINQVNLRLRGETPSYKQIVYSLNPISVMHHLKRKFWDERPDNCEVLRTTYRDNRYIDAEYANELERLAELNPNLHRIYALGEWGTLEGVIYRPFIIGDWPDTAQFSDTFYGLDFGFNNPSALVRVEVYDSDIFVTEEVYDSGLTTPDLIARMDGAGIIKTKPLYCDAAEPDRIEELRRAGYNAIPAHKAQGSVQAGINFCQSLRIHSKPENTNLNSENASYSWRIDKDGNPMDEPVKMNDHAMDAMRYALFTHLGKPRAEFFKIDRTELGF